MDFSFYENEQISKELILSRVSEEQIFAYYIGPEIISRKLFRSKIRNDKNPTCSMYRNKSGTLIYKDFATGEHLSCFNYVMSLYRCNYYEALKIIANDFGIIQNQNLQKNRGKIIPKDIKIEEKEFSKIQVEIQDFTEVELRWWNKYGITKEILEKFDVYSCKHVFLNGQLCAKSSQNCPIFGYYGKKYHGEELWRCYFPKRDSYRFLTNWPSKKIQGYDQLPKKGKLLIITKSQKDNMCLYSMGIPACSPNSETQFISDIMLEELKTRFDNIIVLFDNDSTGISFMNKLKKQHPELIYTWIPRKYEAKDISDFYKMYKREKTLNLIKEFVVWLKNHKNS